MIDEKQIKLINISKADGTIPMGEHLLIPKHKGGGKWFWRITGLFFLFILFCAGYLIYTLSDLPSVESLKNFRPSIISEVLDCNNLKIGEFSEERRILTPLDQIPLVLKQAFVASEDDRFYQHKGIDWHGIARAFVINLLAGEVRQGGSTITQQVAKSLLLNPEKSISRKLREAVLAFRMEKNLSKDEILHLYLNQIYLGNGAYGVTAAAENYFGKKLNLLSLEEASLLAGLIQAPSRYNPYTHMDRAKSRQSYVLSKMFENNFINEAEKETALKAEIKLVEKEDLNRTQAPHFVENVRKYLVQKYGNDFVLNEGLKIYTTLDSHMQKSAVQALKIGLEDLDKRQGYRGAMQTINSADFETFISSLKELNKNKIAANGDKITALVMEINDEKGVVRVATDSLSGTLLLEDMKWARKPDPKIRSEYAYITKPSAALKKGDVVLVKIKKPDDIPEKDPKAKKEPPGTFFSLEQEPVVEGAIVAMDVVTGHIKAMVGGYDFAKSEFNRATQAKRQPGSAFKPIIYASAIDKGYTAAKMIVDAPVVFDDPVQELEWRPKNYGGKFSGDTIFRDALIESRNVLTIKIVDDIGIEYVLDYARKVGVISPIERNLSIALGSSSMTPLELTKIYAVFASGGKIVPPVFIKKIEDREGNILEENVKEPTVILPQPPPGQESPSPTPSLTNSPVSPTPVSTDQTDAAVTSAHFLPDGVISQETSYIITHLLKEVVSYGTGQRVRALGRPTAGKTGTTNENADTWFIGYTPDFVAGVWVGFDEKKSLGSGEVGGHTASPIWLDFMKEAIKGTPVKDFPVPPGIVFVQIDPKSGQLATEKTQGAIFEAFIEGTQPQASSKKEVDKQIKNFLIENE